MISAQSSHFEKFAQTELYTYGLHAQKIYESGTSTWHIFLFLALYTVYIRTTRHFDKHIDKKILGNEFIPRL